MHMFWQQDYSINRERAGFHYPLKRNKQFLYFTNQLINSTILQCSRKKVTCTGYKYSSVIHLVGLQQFLYGKIIHKTNGEQEKQGMKLCYVGPRPNLRLIDQILMRQPCSANLGAGSSVHQENHKTHEGV